MTIPSGISQAEHVIFHHDPSRSSSPRQLKHLEQIRSKAAAWHRSKEGRAWHRQHGKQTWKTESLWAQFARIVAFIIKPMSLVRAGRAHLGAKQNYAKPLSGFALNAVEPSLFLVAQKRKGGFIAQLNAEAERGGLSKYALVAASSLGQKSKAKMLLATMWLA